MSDFVIENGVLKKYQGKSKTVVIPDSVTSIGNWAFYGCERLTSITIPDGVTSIGGSAFHGCERLTSITIPDSVTSIGRDAFDGCISLTSISIPDSVTRIGEHAFYRCKSLTSITIPDSVTSIGFEAFSGCKSLTSITIPDSVTSIGECAFYWCNSLTSITIPDSVTSIGARAFYNCESLTRVTIPDSVTSIGEHAFYRCKSLTNITIPDSVTSIGDEAFYGCSSLTSITIPDSVTRIGSEALPNCVVQIADLPTAGTMLDKTMGLIIPGEKNPYYAFAGRNLEKKNGTIKAVPDWLSYDLEIINNGPKYKFKLLTRLIGALGRLKEPVELTDTNRAMLIELLNKNSKRILTLAETMRNPSVVEDLLSLNILEAKTLNSFRKAIKASPVPEIASLADIEVKTPVKTVPDKKVSDSPLQAEYQKKYDDINGDSFLKKVKLLGVPMPSVKMKDGTAAPEVLFRYLLVSYGRQIGEDYRFDPDADKTADLLSYESLCEAMNEVSGNLDGPNYPAVLPMLCRYGNAKQIKSLTGAVKDWGNWNKNGRKGRTAQDVLVGALVLSDTREAVVWLEKNRDLNNYADVRSITVDEVYEKYLFDFGFDVSGKRVFDLGCTSLEVSLTSDIKLGLFDRAKDKEVKSVPKKGVDPDVYKKVSDEVSDIRQNLKKAMKIKADQLFEAYLDNTKVSAEEWKTRYLENAFLHKVAELIVWSQRKKCFLVTESGLIDSEGNPYQLGTDPVTVAHPMEMKPSEIKEWQQYFAAQGLKQPFQQIWEHVYDKNDIQEDRYNGCSIRAVYLKNQAKRGIVCDWYDSGYYDSRYLSIKGFDVEAEDADVDDDDPYYLTIKRLHAPKWNRRTNHVIAYLDRITVWDRVKKDDVSVMDLMGNYTLAQVMEA